MPSKEAIYNTWMFRSIQLRTGLCGTMVGADHKHTFSNDTRGLHSQPFSSFWPFPFLRHAALHSIVHLVFKTPSHTHATKRLIYLIKKGSAIYKLNERIHPTTSLSSSIHPKQQQIFCRQQLFPSFPSARSRRSLFFNRFAAPIQLSRLFVAVVSYTCLAPEWNSLPIYSSQSSTRIL